MSTTDEERRARLRDEIEARAVRPQDMLADTIVSTVAASIATGSFLAELQLRGWALVHVGNGVRPRPPSDWLDDGLALLVPSGADRLDRLDELWAEAWGAGYKAGIARTEVAS